MTQHTQQHGTWLAASDANLTVDDLWLPYFSVGGNLDVVELDAYLHGLYPLPLAERNTIALVVNELMTSGSMAPYTDSAPEPPTGTLQDLVLDGGDFEKILNNLAELVAARLPSPGNDIQCGITLLGPRKVETVASSRRGKCSHHNSLSARVIRCAG